MVKLGIYSLCIKIVYHANSVLAALINNQLSLILVVTSLKGKDDNAKSQSRFANVPFSSWRTLCINP